MSPGGCHYHHVRLTSHRSGFDTFIKRPGIAGSEDSVSGKENECIIIGHGSRSYPSGYGLAPNGGGFRDICEQELLKIICCPSSAMPSTYLWRGGSHLLADSRAMASAMQTSDIVLLTACDRRLPATRIAGLLLPVRHMDDSNR